MAPSFVSAAPVCLLALPPPFETVTLLPGPGQQIGHSVTPQPRSPGLDDIFTAASSVAMQGAAGAYLTGDGNVVLLDAALTWRITDPAAYALARDHVGPLLDRLFRSAAIAVAGQQALGRLSRLRPRAERGRPRPDGGGDPPAGARRLARRAQRPA